MILALCAAASCREAPKRAAAPPAPPKPARAQPPRQPNFLLIVVDTLRFDATSLASGRATDSPHIAALAGRGISFVNAYSTWDETTGSHFSMLTGFATGLETPVNDPRLSIPHQLKEHGYKTFGTAANLMLSPKATPVVAAFDDYACIGDRWKSMTPAQQRAAEPEIAPRLRAYGAKSTDFNKLMAYVTGKRAVASLREQLDRTKAPFFGFVNIVEPHDPYFPDPAIYDPKRDEADLARPKRFDGDLRNRTLRKVTDRALLKRVAASRKRVGDRGWQTTFDLDDKAMAIYRRRYQCEVREADAVIGEIVEMLRERKLLDSTVLIITSDHGESLGEADLITHAFGNAGDRESTHRVPLLWVFPPAYEARPGKVDVLTSLADVAPTVYEIAGIDWMPIANRAPVPGTYGKSLLLRMSEAARRALPWTARLPAGAITEEQRKQFRSETEARQRSLGYLQ